MREGMVNRRERWDERVNRVVGNPTCDSMMTNLAERCEDYGDSSGRTSRQQKTYSGDTPNLQPNNNSGRELEVCLARAGKD
jgi:hypothetical protein